METRTRMLHGEASESEEEEVLNSTFTQEKVSKENKDDKPLISGEASESESENDSADNSDNMDISDTLPAIEVTATSDLQDSKQEFVPKYDSLLQTKLREKNASLRTHLKAAIRDLYTSSTKDVQAVTLQLTKAHNTIQDASNCMRVVSKDLTQLEDKLDIVTTCSILPDINIKVPEHSKIL